MRAGAYPPRGTTPAPPSRTASHPPTRSWARFTGPFRGAHTRDEVSPLLPPSLRGHGVRHLPIGAGSPPSSSASDATATPNRHCTHHLHARAGTRPSTRRRDAKPSSRPSWGSIRLAATSLRRIRCRHHFFSRRRRPPQQECFFIPAGRPHDTRRCPLAMRATAAVAAAGLLAAGDISPMCPRWLSTPRSESETSTHKGTVTRVCLPVFVCGC